MVNVLVVPACEGEYLFFFPSNPYICKNYIKTNYEK